MACYYLRLSRALSCCVVLLAAGWGTVQPAQAQVAAPTPSNYVLSLSEFATHPGGVTNPSGGGDNPSGTGSDFGAIDVVSPRDGSGRVFVSSQEGRIFGYDVATGNSLGTFLDIRNVASVTGFINGGGASAFRGLMYFDFHPDFNNQGSAGFGKLYTGFQIDENNNTRVSDYSHPSPQNANKYVIGEWTVDASDPSQVDTSSYREVFRLTTEGNNPHAIGEIAFNPFASQGDADYGLLYAAIGDGSAGGNSLPDPGYLQERDTVFGSIIRINPLQDGASTYSIPADNPFVGEVGVAEELYAFGMRDPQTFSFGKDGTGQDVVITFDIGASSREEVDLVRSGGNYGFDVFEGTATYTNRPISSAVAPSDPVLEYDHTTGGFAIIGGLRVTDPSDPDFKDKVLFSDLPTGKMFFADYHDMLMAEQQGTQATIFEINNFTLDGNFVVENAGGGNVTFEDVVGAGTNGARGDARFGTDEAGNVYIVSKQSSKIFATGLVAELSTPQLIPTGIAGDVNQDGFLLPDDIDAFVAGWLADTTGMIEIDQIMLGDLDLSGQTNLLDALILHNALKDNGASGLDFSLLSQVNVPEPTSGFLFLVSSIFLPFYRINRKGAVGCM